MKKGILLYKVIENEKHTQNKTKQEEKTDTTKQSKMRSKDNQISTNDHRNENKHQKKCKTTENASNGTKEKQETNVDVYLQ